MELPTDAQQAREGANLAIFQALGITPETTAALQIGQGLAAPDGGDLARVYLANDGVTCVTIVIDGEEVDIALSDAQAAALVGAATTTPR